MRDGTRRVPGRARNYPERDDVECETWSSWTRGVDPGSKKTSQRRSLRFTKSLRSGRVYGLARVVGGSVLVRGGVGGLPRVVYGTRIVY